MIFHLVHHTWNLPEGGQALKNSFVFVLPTWTRILLRLGCYLESTFQPKLLFSVSIASLFHHNLDYRV